MKKIVFCLLQDSKAEKGRLNTPFYVLQEGLRTFAEKQSFEKAFIYGDGYAQVKDFSQTKISEIYYADSVFTEMSHQNLLFLADALIASDQETKPDALYYLVILSERKAKGNEFTAFMTWLGNIACRYKIVLLQEMMGQNDFEYMAAQRGFAGTFEDAEKALSYIVSDSLQTEGIAKKR